MLKKTHSIFIALVILLVALFAACKKSNDNPAITVANVSGSYKLTSLTWNNIEIYDSLDACEKDNISELGADSIYNFIDAGIQCNPPEDHDGIWYVAKDSFYIDGSGTKIKSFDGKHLVLTGHPTANGIPDNTIIAVTTLTKQ